MAILLTALSLPFGALASMPNADLAPSAASGPLLGGDLDAHGCKGSAGYTWNQELASCVRPWLSSAVTLELAPDQDKCKKTRGKQTKYCWKFRELTSDSADAQWQTLSKTITGFNPMPDTQYRLRVRKDKVEIKNGKGLRIDYTLIKVLK